MRLLFGHPARDEGNTHICTVPLSADEKMCLQEGDPKLLTGYCGHVFKCGYDKKNTRWVSSLVSAHMKDWHPETISGAAAVRRANVKAETRANVMFEAGMNNASSLRDGVSTTVFKMSSETEDLTSAARYYVYGRQRISKQSFEDPYFREALCGSRKERRFLTKRMLEEYVSAEFSIFILFLKFILNKKAMQSMGNPFAQGIHDGVTLGDHKGYESLGINFIEEDWHRNLTVCVGFRQKPKRRDGRYDGSDRAVATLFEDTIKDRTDHNLDDIIAAMISDRAATGVARKLGLDEDGCAMHDVDKLPRVGTGSLLRRDMTKPIGSDGHRPFANPFPEGVALVKKFRSMGQYYHYGNRHGALMTLRSSANLEDKSSSTRIQVCNLCSWSLNRFCF